eukprot:349893-Chlamydomonas_euryale.AAC.10
MLAAALACGQRSRLSSGTVFVNRSLEVRMSACAAVAAYPCMCESASLAADLGRQALDGGGSGGRGGEAVGREYEAREKGG